MTQQLISVRTSTLAVVKKGAEGDLKFPTRADQFLAIQPDLSFSPNFETQENPEIRNDIMMAQTSISGESPSVNFSHLWKGSGTEGQPPEFGTLLEGTFGNQRNYVSSSTIAGSTKKVLKLQTSNLKPRAGDYSKGDMILLKHANHEWEVAVVESGDTTANELTLGLDLVNAPAASTEIGAFRTYFPANADMPAFDMYHYMEGGEGGLETMKDARTVTTNITANAKENINATFTLEGTAYTLNEPEFAKALRVTTGTNDSIVFSQGTNVEETLTVRAGSYTTTTILAELNRAQAALTNNSLKAATWAYSATTDKFTLDRKTSGNLGFAESQLTNNLGFEGALAKGSGEATATNKKSFNSFAHGLTLSFNDIPPVISRNQRLYLFKHTGENTCLNAPNLSFTINTPKTLLTSVCEKSGNFASVITERSASMSVTSFLEENDQRFFKSFSENETVSFLFVGGNKTNDNWRPGQTFGIYGSEATITSFSISQIDTVFAIDMELMCYSPGDGTGSIFCGFM